MELGVIFEEASKRREVADAPGEVIKNLETSKLEDYNWSEARETNVSEALRPEIETVQVNSLQQIVEENKGKLSEVQDAITLDENSCHYDDNGNLYRVGNRLEPNNCYEINGYTYHTDEQGRIVSAEGVLHLKDREGRLPIKDTIEDIGQGDQREGDDRGHLIGDQFDGSNGLENMIPQDAEINRNDYRNLENEWRSEVDQGNEVRVKVEPIYEGNSRRPDAVAVTYVINGEESVRIFPNGKE